MVADLDAVAAVHVPRGARDVQRLAAVVALHQGDHFRREAPLVQQPADAEGPLQAQRDLRLHVGKFLLIKLGRGEGSVELLALHPVAMGTQPAILRCAHDTPGNAVARAVQAAEGPAHAAGVRKQRVLRHLDVLHDDFPGDGGTQAQLALDLRGGEALHALFQDETAHLAVVGVGLRPDDEDIGDRRVGNPGLRTVQHVAAVGLRRAGLHPAGIRTCIGFGQAEAAYGLARGEFRQVFLPLRVGAVGMDREHHQAGLHRHHGPVAAVDPLHLPGDEAIGDVACAGAAEFLGNGDAKQARRAHFGEDRGIGLLVEVGAFDSRRQAVLCKGAGRIADHPLVLGQLIVEAEGIVPGEGLAAVIGGHGGLLNGPPVLNRARGEGNRQTGSRP